MSRKRFICLDCGIDTGKIHEHYFVHTRVWLAAVDSSCGMLCISDLERRLGRLLTPEDFPDVSINDVRYSPKSQLLMDRMHGNAKASCS